MLLREVNRLKNGGKNQKNLTKYQISSLNIIRKDKYIKNIKTFDEFGCQPFLLPASIVYELIIISYLKCDDMLYTSLYYLLIVMNQKLPYRSIENPAIYY